MNEYHISSKFRYSGGYTSRGAQEKYKKDDYFYKINKCGNEGFTEYLVSRLLSHSTLSRGSYVSYEYCKINNRLGCRSKNFLGAVEEFMSMDSLYMRLYGVKGLSDYLASLGSSAARLNFILDLVGRYGFNRGSYYQYLNILLQLDMLILNTDRHGHNYGLVYNRVSNTFRLPPIFDNGLSLGTDRTGNCASCTISGSFTEQVIAFRYPVNPCFKLSYKEVLSDLNRISKLYGNKFEIEKLRVQLDAYKGLFIR